MPPVGGPGMVEGRSDGPAPLDLSGGVHGPR